MNPSLRSRLADPGFWLLLAAIGLGALQYLDSGNRIAGMERNLSVNRRAVFLICWLALAACVWAKRGRRPAAPHPAMAALGCGLLTFTVARLSLTLWDDTNWPLIWPLPAFVGLLLLGSTWRQWHRFWRESICLFLVLINWDKFEAFLESVFNFSKISAAVAEVLLHLFTTYKVERDGIVLTMGDENKYAVEVFAGCTGVPLVSVLGTLGLLICLVVPMSWGRRLWTLALAGIIGHGIGFFRVALLAVVSEVPEDFDYWHGTTGAGIFTTTSVVLYGLFQQRHLDTISDGRAEAWLRGGPVTESAPRPLLVPRIAGSLAAIAALTALVWVNYGRRELPSPALPDTLVSTTWKQTGRTVVEEKLDEETLRTRFERVSAPVTYTLESGGHTYQVKIRSVQGLLGGLEHLASLHSLRPLKTAAATTTPRKLAEGGEILLYEWTQQQHLAALLPLAEPPFVTFEAWSDRTAPLRRDPARLAAWLFLGSPVVDRRAWWIEVTPNGKVPEKELLNLWPEISNALQKAM